MQKTQFSEWHLLERILQRWISTQRKLKQLRLAASATQFFLNIRFDF